MSRLAIVCGGREWGMMYDHNGDLTYIPQAMEIMRRMLQDYKITFVIEGKCQVHGHDSGADWIAGLAAYDLGIPYVEVPALWKTHGKPAGHKRNALMLKMLLKLGAGNDVMVLAFPGGAGTKGMCDIAERAGVFVDRIDVNPVKPQKDIL